MTHDPVCGMQVDESKTAFKSEYKGKAYFFCSEHCKITFDNEPEKYVKKDEEHKNPHHHT